PNFTLWAIFTTLVKNREIVKIEGNLGPDALRILRDVPGVAVEAPGAGAGGGPGDALVRFGRASEPVALAVRRQANAATAWQLVQQARAGPAANLPVVAAATAAAAPRGLRRPTCSSWRRPRRPRHARSSSATASRWSTVTATPTSTSPVSSSTPRGGADTKTDAPPGCRPGWPGRPASRRRRCSSIPNATGR